MGKSLGLIFAAVLLLVGVAFWMTGGDLSDEENQSNIDGDSLAVNDEPSKRELPKPSPELVQSYELEGDLPHLDSSDSFLASHLRLLLTSKEKLMIYNDKLIASMALRKVLYHLCTT